MYQRCFIAKNRKSAVIGMHGGNALFIITVFITAIISMGAFIYIE